MRGPEKDDRFRVSDNVAVRGVIISVDNGLQYIVRTSDYKFHLFDNNSAGTVGNKYCRSLQ